MVVLEAVVGVIVADAFAISGTRTIEPGRAFGKLLLLVDGIDGGADVMHVGSGRQADFVVTGIAFTASDVDATLDTSCTGTTAIEKNTVLSFIRALRKSGIHTGRCQVCIEPNITTR